MIPATISSNEDDLLPAELSSLPRLLLPLRNWTDTFGPYTGNDNTRAVIKTGAKECFFLSVRKFLMQAPPENMLNMRVEHLRFLKDFLHQDMWFPMSIDKADTETLRVLIGLLHSAMRME